MPNPLLAIRKKLVWLRERAKAIRGDRGWMTLCRRTNSYVLSPVFWRRTFILYARDIEDPPVLNESDFKPNIDNFSFKIVTSHEEAARLEHQGFMFRYWPTFDNKKLKYYSKLLNEGATAFCGFAGHELAFIQWAIPSTQALHRITYYRPKVDFASGERYVQGPWTNPKYIRMGLFTYNTYFNTDPHLRAHGGKLIKGPVWEERKQTRKTIESIGYKPYRKARVTRFLWWRFWEGEKPLNSQESQSYSINPVHATDKSVIN